MKQIQLTQGKFALVSDVDYSYLNQFKWYADKSRGIFYAARGVWINGKRKTILMHRVILERMGHNKFKECDHKDGNGLNNCRRNLRSATRSQNACNRVKGKNNTSGFKGVHWVKRDKKWRARIKLNGKKEHLGYYEDKLDAARAYNKRAKELHKEFANVVPCTAIIRIGA